MVILAEGNEITLNDLLFLYKTERWYFNLNSLKKAIKEALKACNYNQTKTAKMPGLTKRQINYKIKKYGFM